MSYLSNIDIIFPPYVLDQEASLDWLSSAYEITTQKPKAELKKLIHRFSAKADQIEMRRHFLPDFSHQRWADMRIFNLNEDIRGRGAHERTQFFHAVAVETILKLYAQENLPPDELIHVTCTGYVSPSAPFHLVSQKNWGKETVVTQLYHMGCFAAIPALRLASREGKRIDVVHTELCSLYFNPVLLTPEQIVIQSLFADGIAKYTVSQKPKSVSFKCELVLEEILPDTLEHMTWVTTEQGFSMTLSRDVPKQIESNIKAFVNRLLDNVDHDEKVFFAIHPGGPKIIEDIAKVLGLKLSQYVHSLGVLKKHGNMSSATLPHIWKAILEDPLVPASSTIISLAFGPGLTMCGSRFVKVAA